MKFCAKCGSPRVDGQVCPCSARTEPIEKPGILTRIKNGIGIGDVERNLTDCYERDHLIVPDSIKATEGEIPVKQYDIAILRTILKFERAEGRIQVTNKRLIFRAPGRSIGGRTTLQHEYAIDEIAGIEAKRNYWFSWLHFFGGIILLAIGWFIGQALIGWTFEASPDLAFILCLLFTAAAMVTFFTIPKEFFLKLILLGVCASSMPILIDSPIHPRILMLIFGLTGLVILFGWFLYFMRPNLKICVKNKTGISPGPVNVRRGFADDRSGFYEVMPTVQSEAAIREVGAIIGDIQKLGDYGVQRWTGG